MKEFADMSARQDEANSSAHHIAMDNLRGKAYREAAKLLNADIEEIALVESTTHGLNIAATSLPLEDGDNIITANLEFIQVALPWCAMRKTKDIEIRVASPKDSRFYAETFEALIDEHTKMIVISTVEWCNGWKMDLKSIGDMCKRRGVKLIVDAVQHLGVGKIDVKECHIDILVAGGHKWLNSPFAAACSTSTRNCCRISNPCSGDISTRRAPGRLGRILGNPAAKAVSDWEFVPTARRFEIGGTSNYPGAIALGETLELVNEIGVENIEKYMFDLTTYCLDMYESIGGTAITHRDADHRSGIVITRLYDDLAIDRDILKKLHAHKIFIAQRFTDNIGGFRNSCQYFNNKKDIDTLRDALLEIIKEIGRAPDYKKN